MIYVTIASSVISTVIIVPSLSRAWEGQTRKP